MVVALFATAQALASGYALWRGGTPERWVAVMLLVAGIADWSMPAGHGAFQSVFWPSLWIDLLLLAGLAIISAFADRFWPTWMTACQIIAVAGHGVRAYEPHILALAYWSMIGALAYPMLAFLVIGSWRHQVRLPSGREFDWTNQRWRHEYAATRQLVVHGGGNAIGSGDRDLSTEAPSS